MTVIEIVQLIATIVSSGAVALILRAQIKSQQEQINAMKANMDSMKSFMDIFKIDEVKKYTELVAYNVKSQTFLEIKHNYIEAFREEFRNDKETQKIMDETLFRNEDFQRYIELFAHACLSVGCLKEDEVDAHIKEFLPKNEEQVRGFLKSIKSLPHS